MSAFGQARAWLRAVLRRRAIEREMHEEMASHITQATARFVARGLSPSAARAAAQREFGNVGVVQGHARDARGGQWIDNLLGDLKYAFRYFARTPLSTITIVLTLALGIGFSSAVFSALHGIFTRPAPGVPDDPSLVKIRGIANAPPFDRPVSFPELRAYSGLTSIFASVAGWLTVGAVVDLGDSNHGSVTAAAQFVTPNFFSLLGVRLAAGRDFSQSRFDDLNPPELTAIIADAFASELFGDARSAIGKRVKVNETPVTIIGLAPPRFNGAVQSGETRWLWMPMSSLQLVARANPRIFTDLIVQQFEPIARLQPGVSVGQALPAVRGVAVRIDADAKAQTGRSWTTTADVVRLRGLISAARYASERGPGAVLASVLAIVILLVCTTTVNSLLVGAGVTRRYEIGVRLAMGASRARIVRQLLTEITILSIAGGALGMWVFGVLVRLTEFARDGFDVSPNWSTTGFTLLYAVLTATLAGLSPALHATRAGLAEVLKDNTTGASRMSRLQRTFVVAQIAIAQPLMVTLAAVVANALNEIPAVENVRLRERLVIADFDTRLRYTIRAPDKMPDLVRRLESLPGVAAVMPIGYGEGWVSLDVRAAASTDSVVADGIPATVHDVPPGYLATVGAPLVRGRDFVASDTMAAVTPAIVSRVLALRLFNKADPIGQRFRRRPADGDAAIELEVVGVVDLAQEINTLGHPADDPPLYIPFRSRGQARLLIRTTTPADAVMPAIVSAAREEARLFPIVQIGTIAQADRDRRGSRIEVLAIGVGCGAITLLLASVGLYAMLSIAVERRRREIGIRVALGARARQVERMFFTSGLRVTLLGLAIGMPLSLVTLAIPLHAHGGAWVNLPRSATMVTLAVVAIASLASWLPARRAATGDPMIALRAE